MNLFPTYAEFHKANGTEEKRRFLAKFPHPFLLVDLAAPKNTGKDYATFPVASKREKSTEFEATLHGVSTLIVMPVVKSSRNTFRDKITVGRSDNNDLIIQHNSVSKLHAFFRKDPCAERFSIYDAGSSFGTLVNGKAATPENGCELESGDTILFAMGISSNFFTSADFHDYMHLLKRAENIKPH
jgi:hypothetical protein